MNVTAAPTFPTLVDDVRTALRQWHGEAAAPSPLRYLYFFRKTLRERQQRGGDGGGEEGGGPAAKRGGGAAARAE